MAAPVFDAQKTMTEIGNLAYATNDAIKRLIERITELEDRMKLLEQEKKGG